jgi:hypothetical protein
MEDCRIARQVAEWNPQGKRRHSRPVNTWKDEISHIKLDATKLKFAYELNCTGGGSYFMAKKKKKNPWLWSAGELCRHGKLYLIGWISNFILAHMVGG